MIEHIDMGCSTAKEGGRVTVLKGSRRTEQGRQGQQRARAGSKGTHVVRNVLRPCVVRDDPSHRRVLNVDLKSRQIPMSMAHSNATAAPRMSGRRAGTW